MPSSTAHPRTPEDATSPSSAVEDSAQPNRLLRAFPADAIAQLEPQMERIDVPLLEVLAEPGVPYEHVFFPETGVISLVNRLADGSEVEVGTIGNEGMAGLNVVLDSASIPSVTLMEIPGEVIRVPVTALVALTEEYPEVRRLLLRYVQAFMIQVGQTAACNRAHEIYGRCARWMCMSHDRMGGAQQFMLTQHVLSQMLGVRRAGVTVAAGQLQRAGFIKYSRGRITILDRPGLESAACECYGIVKREFDRLLGT
jgi:CRP-like cAMP-binding protein